MRHSALVLWEHIEARSNTSFKSMQSFFATVYDKSTVGNKLAILVKLDMLTCTEGITDKHYAVGPKPFDLEKVRAYIRSRDGNKGPIKQGRKQSEASKVRTLNRREVVGKPEKTYKPKAFEWSGAKALQETNTIAAVHKEELAKASPASAVDAAIDAVSSVPIKHLPELKTRLKDLLGEL